MPPIHANPADAGTVHASTTHAGIEACCQSVAAGTGHLAHHGWGDEPGAVVGDCIEALGSARNQLDAALLRAVRSFEARGEHRALQYASVTGWLQHHLHLRRGEAARVARLARFVTGFPQFEAALAVGAINLAHLDVLADAHDSRFADAWSEAEELLVGAAVRSRFEDYARHVRSFADQLAPQDADDRFDQQLDDRNLSKAQTLDGVGVLHADMDAFSFATVSAELDRLERQLFDEDWQAAKERLGRDPQPGELDRTTAQRRHDALVRMAERSRTLAGRHVSARPTVVVHTDQATLESAAARWLGVDGTPAPAPGTGLCELDDGTPVSPASALYAALVGEIRRIVFDPDNDEILNYGRERRIFADAQGDAVRAKYRRCCFLGGCDATHTQTDHIVEWQDLGLTDVANAQRLHDAHNRSKSRTRGDPPHHKRPDTGQRRVPLRKC